MIKVEFNDLVYDVKNKPEEMSVGLFQKICNILTDENDYYFENWLKVINELGLPKEAVNKIDDEVLIKFIESLDFKGDENFIKEFEFDGYVYSAYEGDDFVLGALDLSEIEKVIKNNKNNYTQYIMAILFKRTDLSFKEHYDKGHIDFKAKLFYKHMTADVAIPYVWLVNIKLMKHIEMLKKITTGNVD